MTNGALTPPPPKVRLKLPDVTLCAVSSTNVEATLEAMQTCLQYAEFSDAILLTHEAPTIPPAANGPPIRVVEIRKLTSSQAYSHFMLERLVDHIFSDYCLTVQWDGHIIDPDRWQPEFLEYDYIGASWPQFDDGYNVGNGGFSLRSRRLMELCRAPGFAIAHPEDVAIGRINRPMLEKMGIRFAPAALADAFSAERVGDPARAFGYHGVFLMPQVLGPEKFWKIYLSLDDRFSLRRDLTSLVAGLRPGSAPWRRSLRMRLDLWADAIRR